MQNKNKNKTSVKNKRKNVYVATVIKIVSIRIKE